MMFLQRRDRVASCRRAVPKQWSGEFTAVTDADGDGGMRRVAPTVALLFGIRSDIATVALVCPVANRDCPKVKMRSAAL